MFPNNILRPAILLPRSRSVTPAGNDIVPAPLMADTAEGHQTQPNLPTPSSPSLPSCSTTTTTSSSSVATTGNTSTTPVVAMSREEESLALLQVSREHLQCPVCLDTIRVKPIYQCVNGHTICSTCIAQLTACPLCRANFAYGHARIRNRALETLMDHVQVSCPYQSKGCMQTIKSSSLKEHMLECAFGKFVLCPGLGFENCEELLLPENWSSHVEQAHNLVVHPGRHNPVTLTYSDFLSPKTLKDGCLLKWESIVLKPFADAGPFIIMCEVDVEKNCTATFTCIYAPPKRDDEVDANDAANIQTSYYVEFSIGEPRPYGAPEWVPQHTTTWKGESALYSEYRSGSAKGRFQIPLSPYIYPDAFTPRDIAPTPSAAVDLSALGAAALPLQTSNAAQNANHASSPSRSNNVPEEPLSPPRRRGMAAVRKQNLKIRIRFTKCLHELQQPSCSTQTSHGVVTIRNYIATRNAIYRAIKCSHCSEGPLRGTRFRCIECSKFNLCYRCWSEKDVHSHHYLVCIRSTEQNARMTKNFKRIFRQGPQENGDRSATDDENEPIIAPPKRARKTPAASARRNVTFGEADAAAARSSSPAPAIPPTPPRGNSNVNRLINSLVSRLAPPS